ncbi:MAG: hypothetical protein HY556_06180 [Euryarchaeota archaeon]|nr:hypothetical protein [Euryarchaeota archaeon]
MAMQRELAWRVFAGEYNDSRHEYSTGEERAPSFVITPTGAKVNRLFLVGVLTSTENVGKEGDVWRARISDPTGVFTVYAGQYQPQAAQALAEIKAPAIVAVVGKSRTYTPDGGAVYASVRPEFVRVVTKEERDHWVLTTAKSLAERLEALREAAAMEKPSVDELVALGYTREISEGVIMGLERYGKLELDRYEAMLQDSLSGLVPELAGRPPSAKPRPIASAATVAESAPSPVAPPVAGSAPTAASKGAAKTPAVDPAHEDVVLGIVADLEEGRNGAPWEGLIEKSSVKGLSEEQVEEAINSLLDKGLLYEPILGRLKKA